MSPRKRKRPRKKERQEEVEEEQQDEEQQDEERLSSGQRYTLLVAVLVILGVGVIFIDTILAWVMGLLGRQ
jgi:hypothetical protein